MRVRIVGLVALMALVLASCGGTTPEAAGPSEGIGVRGAWTIDVYETDGSVAARVEFHNEFTGEEVLADLLSLADTMSGWNLSAQPGGGPKICDTGSGGCSFEGTAARDAGTNELVVEGSFTPEFDSTVTQVHANIVSATSGNRAFSSKLLEAGDQAPVKAGQTVHVEVRYSFGTLP